MIYSTILYILCIFNITAKLQYNTMLSALDPAVDSLDTITAWNNQADAIKYKQKKDIVDGYLPGVSRFIGHYSTGLPVIHDPGHNTVASGPEPAVTRIGHRGPVHYHTINTPAERQHLYDIQPEAAATRNLQVYYNYSTNIDLRPRILNPPINYQKFSKVAKALLDERLHLEENKPILAKLDRDGNAIPLSEAEIASLEGNIMGNDTLSGGKGGSTEKSVNTNYDDYDDQSTVNNNPRDNILWASHRYHVAGSLSDRPTLLDN